MKIPKRLTPLLEDGLIDEVIGQLKSGKEAQVYVVRKGDNVHCAKVYKEANKRNFKQAVQYQEGRTVRNSRRARAMNKRTSFGKKESEQAWLTAEVDALYRLAAAGVRVPEPYSFIDGVLLMELIRGDDGLAAPRLGDIDFSEALALEYHGRLIKEIVLMLGTGLVHGDLSEFNVLVDESGPVIIDLPQAVDAAGNNSARKMLERDVNNMKHYFAHFAPALHNTAYGKEIWHHYESGTLTSETILTGEFKESTELADVEGVMEEIDAAREEEFERQRRIREADEDA